MAVREIIKRDGEFWFGMHIIVRRHLTGDCNTPATWDDLFFACYDHHQMTDDWKDGDILKFRNSEFARIESYHVIPVENESFKSRDEMFRDLPE